MIEYIALLLVIYGWTVPFFIKKQERSPYEFVASCSFITVILFVFSVFQNLRIGLLVVTMLGNVGVFVSIKQIISSRKCRNASFQRLFSLSAIFILAFFTSWGADYWAWDEFSHWGTQVDYLLLNGNLHKDSKLLLFPEYIPGMSLWRYFGRDLLATAGVSGSYFISFVLMFSCIYALSYNRSIIKWLLKALIVFFGLFIFFQTLVNSLTVDPVQSLLLLCALKIASEDNAFDFIYLLLATVVVILTKHVGLIFSFFIVCYYVSLQLFAYKNPPLIVFKRAGIIFLSALTFYIIWFSYVNYYALSRSVIDTSKFLNDDIVGSLVRFWVNIIGVLDSRFPHASFIKPTISIVALSHGVALWVFTLVILIFGFILTCLPCKNKKVSLINFLFLLTSCLSYLLFLAFVRASTPWGGDPYSFSRYFCVLLFPCFFLQILAVLNDSITRISFIGLAVIVFFLVVSPPLNTIISFDKRPEILINNEYNQKALLVKKYAGFESVVWYINNENAMAYFVFRSKIMPLKVPHYSKGWGLYLNESLKWQEGIEKRVDSFAKSLCDVDFIFVDNVPPEFWKQYSILFDKSNGRLYKIKQVDDKQCRAVFIT